MKTKIINIGLMSVVFVFLLTISGISQAQTKLQKGRDYMDAFDYSKALQAFNEYFLTTSPTIENARDVAECYLMTNDTKSAADWMQKVISFSNHNADDDLLYGKLLMANGEYVKSLDHFTAYKIEYPDGAQRADKWIVSSKLAKCWMENPEYILVQNETELNSPYSEFGLVKFMDEYFITSDRKIKGKMYSDDEITGWSGNPYFKLFMLPEESDGSLDPSFSPVEDLNNKYHNGPAVYDEGSKTVYFTRTKMVKVEKRPVNSDPTSWYDNSSAGDYVNRLEIYYSTYSNGVWKSPKAFAYNDAEEYSVGHPALSPDGKTLYFVSDQPGGYGESDIYYCTLNDDGSWSQPINAGSKINSEGKEVFPYMDSDGTLYFSSDGWPGMGGLDLFSAKGSENLWSEPVNLRYPMNSPKDDFSIFFTTNSEKGYLASNRDGGQGMDDIYSFMPDPPKVLTLIGTTYLKKDDASRELLAGVNIELDDAMTGDNTLFTTDANGKFMTTLDCGSSYKVAGSLDGYFADSKEFSTICKTKSDTIYVDLNLDKIEINKPIVLENIYYDFDKWNIRPDAAIELDKLVKILEDNPKIVVELGSHTDSRGTDIYNEDLSQKRAESAVDYIISKGISADRITAKGYGESVLTNNCADGVNCDETAHQKNRRTEFKVTGINVNK